MSPGKWLFCCDVFALKHVAWMEVYFLPTFRSDSCLNIGDAKIHVEWGEAELSIIVDADTVHVTDDGVPKFHLYVVRKSQPMRI